MRRYLIAFLLSCACSGEDVVPQRLVLERRPCFGVCPSYRLTIAADGTVEYDGVGWFVALIDPLRPVSERRRLRRDTTHLAPNDVAALATAFDRSWSAWRPNRFRGGRLICPGAGTHSATLTIVRERGPARDTLEAYYGCPYIPSRIDELGAFIDSVVGVDRWRGPMPAPPLYR